MSRLLCALLADVGERATQDGILLPKVVLSMRCREIAALLTFPALILSFVTVRSSKCAWDSTTWPLVNGSNFSCSVPRLRFCERKAGVGCCFCESACYIQYIVDLRGLRCLMNTFTMSFRHENVRHCGPCIPEIASQLHDDPSCQVGSIKSQGRGA